MLSLIVDIDILISLIFLNRNETHTQADHDEPIIIPSSSPTVPPPAAEHLPFDDSIIFLSRADPVFTQNGSFSTLFSSNEPDSNTEPHADVVSPGHQDIVNGVFHIFLFCISVFIS